MRCRPLDGLALLLDPGNGEAGDNNVEEAVLERIMYNYYYHHQ